MTEPHESERDNAISSSYSDNIALSYMTGRQDLDTENVDLSKYAENYSSHNEAKQDEVEENVLRSSYSDNTALLYMTGPEDSDRKNIRLSGNDVFHGEVEYDETGEHALSSSYPDNTALLYMTGSEDSDRENVDLSAYSENHSFFGEREGDEVGDAYLVSSRSSEENRESMSNIAKITSSPIKSSMEERLLEPFDLIESEGIEHHAADTDGILTKTIHLEDDPSLNPWTFRTLVLGTALSIFGSGLATIYTFKPQSVLVSTIFFAVISYVLGETLRFILPRYLLIGKILNPQPFNKKEHAAIIIMANAASMSALGIETLAVERLYYGAKLNAVLSIFLMLSSQFLGFGIAGLMRRTLVYPKLMLWPMNIPVNSLLETLHRGKSETKKALRFFWIVFALVFVYEIVPEWILPMLAGFSVFCLANQKSQVYTNLFGGSSVNEGLGFLSWCMDWQLIGGLSSPLFLPLDSLFNQLVGYLICIALFMGTYYSNLWDAKNFPFLSSVLFSQDSTPTIPVQWNQTAVIGSNNLIDPEALKAIGVPFFATTFAVHLVLTNMAIAATLSHLLLWNYNDMKSAWSFLRYLNKPWDWFQGKEWNYETNEEQERYDPHYRVMSAYGSVPDWCYGIILVLSFAGALVVLYLSESTLPWWAFLIACLLAYLFIAFFGAQMAITGVPILIRPAIQMIGGYLVPGSPVANIYFTIFANNAAAQGQLLAGDLKLAQYAHLSPRCTFTMQIFGTLVGTISNYFIMNEIVTNQQDILLSIKGTSIWSGQKLQQFNSHAVAWGSLTHELFSIHGRYEWATIIFFFGFLAPFPFYFAHRIYPKFGFQYINTAIILWFSGILRIGANSGFLVYFILGFGSQFYARKYQPDLFLKYNYLLSGALAAGTSVIVFILSFVIFGADGEAKLRFPQWWGNNVDGFFDMCFHAK